MISETLNFKYKKTIDILHRHTHTDVYTLMIFLASSYT
jgi:hypothetical protein